jgi:hypothetical protein
MFIVAFSEVTVDILQESETHIPNFDHSDLSP